MPAQFFCFMVWNVMYFMYCGNLCFSSFGTVFYALRKNFMFFAKNIRKKFCGLKYLQYFCNAIEKRLHF